MTLNLSVYMKKQIQLIALSTLLCLSSQANALKSDREKPANIEADNTEIDFKTGVRTLTDNVLFVQGTMRLKADKLIANFDKKGNFEKASAWGSLARVKLRPDNQPDDVEGWGKKMVVDHKKNTITLTGNAAFRQGEKTARGETIIYNMTTDKLRILGNSSGQIPGTKSASADPSTPPKRTITDPFSDDNQGPKGSSNKISSNFEQTQRLNNKTSKSKPVENNRSRLIIQPKSLKN